MLVPSQLPRPVIAAPMAGGPSTPELVCAVGEAGGIGFLSGGFLGVETMLGQIERVRAAECTRFGVNLFVPERDPQDLDAARRYRFALTPVAERFGVAPLPEPRQDDDGFSAKLEALLADPVPAVSFTFGCPDAQVIAHLHAAGTTVAVTVTCVEDARYAAGAGADVLVVQGPEAGGHRSTFTPGATPGTTPLLDLLDEVRGISNLELVAAGGLTTPESVAAALERADAVQLGTAFLLTDEAGTSPTHRAALQSPDFTETVVTRVFSGRPARGLRNAWVDEFGGDTEGDATSGAPAGGALEAAPAAYPAVNQVAGPIRRAAAAAGEPQWTHLWAGTQWREASGGSAAQVIERLLPR